MRGKIIFVVGLATGYVLGTRAGRERYEQIKAGAQKVWNTPTVQSGVQKAQDFAGARVDTVKADLSHKARNALGALIGREPLSGPQRSAAASNTGSTRPKTTATKPAARKPASTSSTKSPTSSTTKASAQSSAAADAESDE
ncbi:YtxH domain-containing protein [Herbiconiux sp. CPCC 205763]|uniref:YtxH domain-containing protein n=1 Tax=Herbiconiux aconitum TaxID=2970913 RepID=A0ABT2GQA7_9MICO|nr:YtxH domain-containing protein [Herbiconiux aconitum]MCS5717480.1 YtxH domain-containing protein [Herbiconiux aconitum]